MRIIFRLSLIGTAVFLSACGSGRPALTIANPPLRPPVFGDDFRHEWDDGASELSSYETVRLRAGALRHGNATSAVRRLTYSEDERVAIESAKPALTDLFPAMQMIWLERFSEGTAECEEMTASAIALTSVDGRVAGSETKSDFSSQSWDGLLFHQLLFDATGVRSHQYSHFENEGDEQITLPYPGNGVSDDALWFWSRHMAAPTLKPGEQQSILLLPSLRDARSRHRALSWNKATLARARDPRLFAGKPAEIYSVHTAGGATETFLVESATPFRVLHWEDSSGERADFISSSRIKSWNSQK